MLLSCARPPSGCMCVLLVRLPVFILDIALREGCRNYPIPCRYRWVIVGGTRCVFFCLQFSDLAFLSLLCNFS